MLPNGAADVYSPIPAEQFYKEMSESVTKYSADPNWSGWYGFKNLENKFVALQIRTVIGVEEI